MARKHTRAEPAPGPVEIGDYFAYSIFDDWYVGQKTGTGWRDHTHGPHCSTEHGARAMAALMNQARDLAHNWRSVRNGSPWKDGDPQAWAVHMIASAVCDAVDSPKPSGLGQRLASQIKSEAA